MPGYVIDANILIGMLISGKASYKQLLSYFQFVSPDFILEEIEKYKDEIKRKTKMEESQLLAFTWFVFSKLTILPNYFLTEEAKYKAAELTFDIDPKDITYIAIALQLDMVLLTNDKPLATGLRKKGFRKVMLWEEFLKANC